MERIGIVFLDGVVFASQLFLVSAGLTFIYGVMRILNTAHGSLYGFGAYLAAFTLLGVWPVLMAPLGPLAVAVSLVVQLLCAIAVGVTLGPLLEKVVGGSVPALGAFLGLCWSTIVLRNPAIPDPAKPIIIIGAAVAGIFIGRYVEAKLPSRPTIRGEVLPLILTFGIFLILEDVLKLVFDVRPLLANMPFTAMGAIGAFGVTYPIYNFSLAAIAGIAGLLLWFTITRTNFGKMVTAVITDREVSSAIGINVPRVFTFAFIIGATMAAVGGAFVAPSGAVVPGVVSVEAIILAFAVTTIGGLGSVPGAAIGAILVGLMRATAVHFRPELDLFVIYAMMTLILLIKPQGLFGGVEARRI